MTPAPLQNKILESAPIFNAVNQHLKSISTSI